MLSWTIGAVKVKRIVELEMPVPYSTSRPFLVEATPEVLLAPELIFEVQPVAADRERIADAPAGQAVGWTGPARLPRIALHGGLRRAERAVVAEAGCDRRGAGDRAGGRAHRGRAPLAAAVGAEADAARLHRAPFGSAAHADAALGVLAEPPAALQHAEVLLGPAVGRQWRWRCRRWRRLGDRRRLWRLDRLGWLDRLAQGHLVLDVGFQRGELSRQLPAVGLAAVERGLQDGRGIRRRLRRGRRRRLEHRQVCRWPDRRTGAQKPRDDQQGQDQQQAHQQRGQPTWPTVQGTRGHCSNGLLPSSLHRLSARAGVINLRRRPSLALRLPKR